MLLAYSDASVIGDACAATTLIVTEDAFVTCFTKKYTNVSSSTEAELLGVLQTMEYIGEHCKQADKVVMLMDNRSVAMKYIRILSAWSVPQRIGFRDKYVRLLELSKNFNVNIQHIRGHQHTHNPNKVCDILSKVCISI